jgi:hypothetical protein
MLARQDAEQPEETSGLVDSLHRKWLARSPFLLRFTSRHPYPKMKSTQIQAHRATIETRIDRETTDDR